MGVNGTDVGTFDVLPRRIRSRNAIQRAWETGRVRASLMTSLVRGSPSDSQEKAAWHRPAALMGYAAGKCCGSRPAYLAEADGPLADGNVSGTGAEIDLR